MNQSEAIAHLEKFMWGADSKPSGETRQEYKRMLALNVATLIPCYKGSTVDSTEILRLALIVTHATIEALEVEE